MSQPLVLRPPYGSAGGVAVGESKLPSGPPAGRGVSLDKDIPGSSTFAKPENDIRDFDHADDSSIHRVDGPDGLLKKDQKTLDERHHEQFKPSIGAPGPRDPSDQSITKYPYRDGIPNAHNASAMFVAEMWKLRTAHEVLLRAESSVRVAAKLDEILSGLNPKTIDRASACTASLKRADVPNMRWILSVDCGNGPKVVKVKAVRKGNVTKITKMDLLLSCSCNAWRWLGSEHHAKGDQYLDGKPRGTASTPVVKDPQGINRVCKHVAAALSLVKRWDVPLGKGRGRAKQKVASIEEMLAMVRRACENTWLHSQGRPWCDTCVPTDDLASALPYIE